MKSGHNHQGFTIVETMIVLAVTSAILISALSLIGGSQNKTQFSQAINDINTQIGSVANNVANGYYASTITGKSCKVDASGEPYFQSGGGGLGRNSGCIYLGRIIQFTEDQTYHFHNVLGRRQVLDKEVTDMADANARIIESSAATPSYPNTSEEKQLPGGLTVGYMAYVESGVSQKTSAVAFIGSLASSGPTADSIESGAQTVDVAPMKGSLLSHDKTAFITRFDGGTPNFSSSFNSVRNPDSGVIICFNSGTTDQVGIITVGQGGRRGSTSLAIKDGRCSDYDPT